MNEKLLAYYLGALEGQDRLEIEEQLLTSPAVLMDFIALKRSFELQRVEGEAAGVENVPSAAAARLRREVERKFGARSSAPTTSFDLWRWMPTAVAAGLFALSGGTFLYTKMDTKMAEKPRGQIYADGKTNCSVEPANDLVVNQHQDLRHQDLNTASNTRLTKTSSKNPAPTPVFAESEGEGEHPKDSR